MNWEAIDLGGALWILFCLFYKFAALGSLLGASDEERALPVLPRVDRVAFGDRPPQVQRKGAAMKMPRRYIREYVIRRNTFEPLYWSVISGWTDDLDEATKFTGRERRMMDPPQDARWQETLESARRGHAGHSWRE